MKKLRHYKGNAEEDYITTPISVLRYITELENHKKGLTLFLIFCSLVLFIGGFLIGKIK